ncbi:DUF4157 domain-containing protein [Leisingera daeponensis]|uniref:DUF4157 domain-containing protein n=1 Tax=Leisingera daeponensis TaxID=405746 RepID=A0ABS7NH66_9RHOB|nr:DUF4157 domain-containing protein [Leisingera daeponensis]MBY6057626.1 DUF4157 domain-containing protein [Leisingera daeponensis]MBY6140554.1 DUF4157 domain-containing protein [Leisingera daeponensis]
MAIKPDDVKAQVEALGGKKAKRKKLKTEPEGTKGKKLPGDVRKGLEAHFSKAKLAKVQVHSGGNAKDVCKELKAKAFTYGNDIYFMKPGDAKNPELLVHELAHVLQQGKGRMPKAKDGVALTSK